MLYLCNRKGQPGSPMDANKVHPVRVKKYLGWHFECCKQHIEPRCTFEYLLLK